MIGIKEYIHHKELVDYSDEEIEVKFPICNCETNMEILARNDYFCYILFYCKNCGSWYKTEYRKDGFFNIFYDVKTKKTLEEKDETNI